MIRLLTRGDDFGSFRCADRAIKDAFQQGILRNTSLMVPAPYFAEAAQLCRELPDLCIGLHATINCEWNEVRWGPVLGAERVPSLVLADGTFFKDTVELYRLHPSHEEILAELAAQLQCARDAGVHIRYMDIHMCFDWYDGLNAQLREYAQSEGLFLSAWQGNDTVEMPLYYLPAVEGSFTDPIEALLAQLQAIDPAKDDKPYLMVTHPCYPDAEIANITCGNSQPGDIATGRNIDRQLFMDPRVTAYCAQRGIELVQYADLPL